MDARCSPPPTPRGARLAVPLAVVAALLAGTGIVSAATLAPTAPAPARPPAPHAAAPAPTYLLKAPGFTIRLVAEPTRQTRQQKVPAGVATWTSYDVVTPTAEQLVRTLALPRGMGFRRTAKGLLEANAHNLGLTVTHVTTGQVDGHPYAQAIVTDPRGARSSWRTVLVGRTCVDVVSTIDAFPALMGSLRLR